MPKKKPTSRGAGAAVAFVGDLSYEAKALRLAEEQERRATLCGSLRVTFEELIASKADISDEVFQSAVEVLIDELKVPVKTMRSDLPVTPATISRWKNGKSLPTPLARKAVLPQFLEYVIGIEEGVVAA